MPSEIAEGVQIAVKDNGCVLTVKNLYDINVSKLLSPSRLVIDAYINKPKKDEIIEDKKWIDSIIDEGNIPFKDFAIDAGHGGYDAGLRCGSSHEKDIALSLVRGISNILEKKGRKVFLTRKSDYTVSIRERIKLINQRSPEIFISIHMTPNNEFVIYSPPPQAAKSEAGAKVDTGRVVKSIAIAKTTMQSLTDEFKINVRHENLSIPVITQIGSPAILIELPCSDKFKYDKNTKDRLINAILKGILKTDTEG
jgi:N-acetylmuramoyl-L-alanine amidase